MGYCSRARAAELITAGQVRLNGSVPRDAETPVRLGRDKIEVDGQEVRAAKKTYWMLNKPRGTVTTASDEKGRQTVYDHLDADLPWVAPVGRLDQASEGLLLPHQRFEMGRAHSCAGNAPAENLSRTDCRTGRRRAARRFATRRAQGRRSSPCRAGKSIAPGRTQQLAGDRPRRRQEPPHPADAE